MAINSRQNNLFAAEDWAVAYQAYSQVDLQAYDFDTIRNAMVNYIKTNFRVSDILYKANHLNDITIPYSLKIPNVILNTDNNRLFEKYRKSGYSNVSPIFIVGMPRSGTTLVEQILSSHPKVFGADEIDFICEVGTEKQKALAGAIGDLGELKHSSIGEELPYYEHYVVLPSTYRKVHFQTFFQLRYRTKLGEARNRYSEENALYKTMAQSMNKIFKTYEKQPQ